MKAGSFVHVLGIMTLAALFSAACGGGGGGGGGTITIDMQVPTGLTDAALLGAAPGQQAGWGLEGGTTDRVILVNGDLSSTTILSPGGFDALNITDTDGVHQVGYSTVFSGFAPAIVEEAINSALMFSGTEDSLVSLHPSGYYSSEALAVDGTQQVGRGRATSGALNHPLLWTGTAASVVDLLPSGFVSGSANDVNNGVQVGFARVTGFADSRAARWQGTAASFENLHPAGFVWSKLNGISATDMVGTAGTSADPADFHTHAFRLVGNTVTDLHPAGKVGSEALRTDGHIQVGFFTVSEQVIDHFEHACYWKGSAGSFVDLHALLPEDTVYSRATGVSGKVITGYAQTPSHTVPVIWNLP